jgi:hypothetical protein
MMIIMMMKKAGQTLHLSAAANPQRLGQGLELRLIFQKRRLQIRTPLRMIAQDMMTLSSLADSAVVRYPTSENSGRQKNGVKQQFLRTSRKYSLR